MSLSVNDPRSRGRSKSPGGRDRSGSRDARALSPAQPVRSSKTKKYYESDSSEESSESTSESDHRSSRNRHKGKRYEEVDSKYRRAPSPNPQTTSLARGERPAHSADLRYEQDYRDTRQSGYAETSRYAQARQAEYSRYSSYGKTEGVSTQTPSTRSEHAPPDQHKREYDCAESHEKTSQPPAATEHCQTRGLSLNTSGDFHVKFGHGQPPQSQYAPLPYAYPPPPSGYTQPSPYGVYPNPDSTRPDAQRTHSGSITNGRQQYVVPEPYKYAEPPQQLTYINKTDPHSSHYTQAPYAHVEIDQRKPSRHTKEVEVDLARIPSHRIEEIEIEERRLSRHPSEVEIDVIRRSSHVPSEYDRRKTSQAQVVEIHPGGGSLHATPSPDAGSRMHRLSISTGAAGALSLAAPGQHTHQHGAPPPGSPLLEAYHGTYQSMSPMPSLLMLPSKMDEGLSDLEPLDGDTSSDYSTYHRKPKKSILVKRVSIYDPEADALSLAAALNHHSPKTEPIITVLPHLSDDHMMALRTEYKKHIKVGGKGINIAKHIKLKVTGNLGKIAYATALGRWEGEAHWANFWYQSGSSRRELLIESLMGKANSEIRAIKEAFSDKRYSDSLEKCMQTELKKDKFRNAVLLALEEKRMEELTVVSKTLVRRDVDDLYKALVSKDGGETAMIEIIVVRSDTHLRDVLREFETRYRKNFAREMIQKSRNLVGETLAHILNGVLNRPVRDALLLHQALAETSKDRTELLISRLVRFHWEPEHLERVKVEYKRKYGNKIEVDVQEGTKGEFGEFCLGLLEAGR